MTLKKSALLLLVVLFGVSTLASAQNFGKRRLAIYRTSLNAGLDESSRKARIHWQFSKDDWGDIFMHYDEGGKVYYARRATEKGIEAFALGKAYVEKLRSENKVTVTGEVDWTRPYVVRLIAEKEYVVEGYYETMEIDNLFSILDEILNQRVIPIFQGRQPGNVTHSDFQIAARVGFPSRKFWRWKFVPKELEVLKLI